MHNYYYSSHACMQIICIDCELKDLECPTHVFRGDYDPLPTTTFFTNCTTTFISCQSGIWSCIDININILSIAFAFVMINQLSKLTWLFVVATVLALAGYYVEGILFYYHPY